MTNRCWLHPYIFKSITFIISNAWLSARHSISTSNTSWQTWILFTWNICWLCKVNSIVSSPMRLCVCVSVFFRFLVLCVLCVKASGETKQIEKKKNVSKNTGHVRFWQHINIHTHTHRHKQSSHNTLKDQQLCQHDMWLV